MSEELRVGLREGRREMDEGRDYEPAVWLSSVLCTWYPPSSLEIVFYFKSLRVQRLSIAILSHPHMTTGAVK